MGSTSLYRAPGMSDREFFEQEFSEALTKRGRIVECATVGNVFYAAVQDTDGADAGTTWALVVLMTRGRGDYNFTYKEMGESMGPSENRCPVRILDLLSPTDSEYAIDWRQRCRADAAARAAKGTIRLNEKVRFTSPENLAALGVVTRTDARSGVFLRADTGTLIKVSWWRRATWESVTD